LAGEELLGRWRHSVTLITLIIPILVSIGCQDGIIKKHGAEQDQDTEESSPVKTSEKAGPLGGTGVANFGSTLPPSAPHLRSSVVMRLNVQAQQDDALELAGPSVTADYAVVGCTSGYLPSGSFTESGSRILYRSDRNCAIAITSITVNGATYTLHSGAFQTAQGSSNVFSSLANNSLIAIVVETQLSANLAPVGEEAVFKAHMVSPGGDYSMADFLIVNPVASNARVDEDGTVQFDLGIQGSSEDTVTIHYTITGTALPINDYTALSGTVDVPPGATTVAIPITLVDDAVPEIDETIVLNISNNHPGYYSTMTTGPTITIDDNDIVYPTTGLVYRYQPAGQVITGGLISSWSDSSGNNFTATQGTSTARPTRILAALNGFDAASFDGGNDLLSPPQNATTTESNFTAKTFSAALRTGTGVANRQVIYRQGNIASGMVLYIQGGFLYFAAYSNGAGNPTLSWGVRHVRAPVAADTTYIVRAVYDQPADQLRLYLDSELAATASNIGTYRFVAGQGSAIGGANVSMRYHDGATGTGSYFQGLIYEFAHFNDTTAGNTGLSLDIFLYERYGLAIPNKVSVASSATGIAEDGGTATITVSRSQVGATALEVPLVITGTASAGSDYEVLPTSVTILAYQTSVTFLVTSIDDAVEDSGEVINIEIDGTGQGYTLGPNPSVSIEIADDETYTAHSSQFIWYQASNATLSGNAATAWPNSIPGGLHNATIPTTATQRPQYVAAAINGRPALSFDGGDRVTIPASADIGTSGPYTHRNFALVFRTGAGVAANQILYKQGNANIGLSIYINGGNLYFEVYNNSGIVFNPRISGPVAINSNYFAILSFNAATGELSGRINGADMTSSTNISQLPTESGSNRGNSIGFVTGRTKINGVSITTAFFNGHLAEFLYFNTAMTWARIAELEEFFLGYYGL
jgi:hypothetical protein